MASILSGNQYQQTNPQENNPIAGINNIINQILNSVNPQNTFQQILQQSSDAKNAMQLINQYGNGDPKQAFINYMNSTGKQNLGKEILQRFGIN